MAAIDTLSGIPKEDLKALAIAGILRRNVVSEVQAVMQYLKIKSESDIKVTAACEQVAARHGMSSRTFFRVLKIYLG